MAIIQPKYQPPINGNEDETATAVPASAILDDNETKEDTISIDNEANANETTENTTKQVVEEEDEEEVLNSGTEATGAINKPKKKKCQCNKQGFRTCWLRCCPFFPRCCQLPLQNCLQLLAVTDLVVTFVNIGIWIYFHQYDPFTHNRRNLGNNISDILLVTSTPASKIVTGNNYALFDISEFHETTTSIYGNQLGIYSGDGGVSDGVRFSKLGYVYRRYQQEVENMCGRKYYLEFLLGHNLAITAGVFSDLLVLTYVSEFMYQFMDISILVTTCCFFDYISGRLFLIFIWNLELLPVLAKIYLIVESRSRRLCILQYGLGKNFRGIDAMLYLHFLPMMIFRAYKLLVFTYFVNSILELGNLEHQTRIEGITLHEYVEKHDEYLRMDKNRDKSSSEEDDAA